MRCGGSPPSPAGTAVAQDTAATDEVSCVVPELRTDVRPNPDGPPTEVEVGMRMVDLMGIDDISQTLTGDFIVILNWIDPRLAELEGCEVPLADIWDPGVVIVNSGRKFPSLPLEAGVGPGGWVRYVQRYGRHLCHLSQSERLPIRQAGV